MRKARYADFLRICRIGLVAALFFLIVFWGFKAFINAKWDGHRRFTLVADGEPLLLFSLEPDSKKAILITIPGNSVLEVPFGYSSYPASSIYKLGNLDTKKGGGKLLSKSIENTFGVVVEGFLATKGEKKFSFPEQASELTSLKKSYFSLPGFLPSFLLLQSKLQNIDTNLSFIDMFRLWDAIRKLRSDQITTLDLAQSQILSDEKLPDGTFVKNFNQDLLDQVTASHFQDKMVRLQNVSVEVINATDVEKVAFGFSRILQHMGVNVVVTSTATHTENFKCKVLFFRKGLVSSIIIERLTRFYQCQKEEGKGTAVSDIKVILGEEFLQ